MLQGVFYRVQIVYIILLYHGNPDVAKKASAAVQTKRTAVAVTR